MAPIVVPSGIDSNDLKRIIAERFRLIPYEFRGQTHVIAYSINEPDDWDISPWREGRLTAAPVRATLTQSEKDQIAAHIRSIKYDA